MCSCIGEVEIIESFYEIVCSFETKGGIEGCGESCSEGVVKGVSEGEIKSSLKLLSEVLGKS